MPNFPRCDGTGKVCYDKRSAQEQRNWIKKEHGSMLRFYQCPSCNWFHLANLKRLYD